MHPRPYNPPPGAYPAPGAYGPGPYGRNVPRYGHPGDGSRRGGCSCLKMYCCCCCCLFITVVLILGAFVAAYFIIDPQMPKISMDGFESKSFDLSEGGLKSELQAGVKAENPNKYIEFVFGEAKDSKDNSFQIFYSNLMIGSGILPIFTLSKKNSTTVKMDIKGQVKKESFAEGTGDSLAEKLKNNEKIPLLTVAMVPVKFMLSGHELFKDTRFVVNVNTTMNVSNLPQGKDIGISDTKTDIAFYVNKNYYKLSSK